MKYNLVGIEDKPLDALGYTCKALRSEGLRGIEPELKAEVLKNPDQAIGICLEYIKKANEASMKDDDYLFLHTDIEVSIDDWEDNNDGK